MTSIYGHFMNNWWNWETTNDIMNNFFGHHQWHQSMATSWIIGGTGKPPMTSWIIFSDTTNDIMNSSPNIEFPDNGRTKPEFFRHRVGDISLLNNGVPSIVLHFRKGESASQSELEMAVSWELQFDFCFFFFMGWLYILVGGEWLPSILFSHSYWVAIFIFPYIGLRLSSQLTKSYFSEGWPNHQPVYNYVDMSIDRHNMKSQWYLKSGIRPQNYDHWMCNTPNLDGIHNQTYDLGYIWKYGGS